MKTIDFKQTVNLSVCDVSVWHFEGVNCFSMVIWNVGVSQNLLRTILGVQSVQNIDRTWREAIFFQNVSVWHPEKLSPWSQRAEIHRSLPYIIFVNGSHIVIDGKSQNCIKTSIEKFSILTSHTDALYISEEIDPLDHQPYSWTM